MRFVVGTIILACIGWVAYWFYASGLEKDAIEREVARMRQAGYEIGWESFEFGGFPYRFDIHLEKPHVSTPDDVWRWQGEAFYTTQLAYKPWHLILAWPGTHAIDTPLGRFTLEGERVWASLKAGRHLPVRLRSERLEIKSGRLTLPDGREMTAGSALIAFTRHEAGKNEGNGGTAGTGNSDTSEGAAAAEKAGAEHAGKGSDPLDAAIAGAAARSDQDGYLRLVALKLPDGTRKALGLPDSLPATIGRIEIDLSYGTASHADMPWPLDPAQSIAIRSANLLWGDVALKARGVVRRDENGQLAGALEITTANLPEIISLAREAGVLTKSQADLITRFGEELARQQAGEKGRDGAQRGEEIRLPLRFESGRTRLLGLDLGPAPRI